MCRAILGQIVEAERGELMLDVAMIVGDAFRTYASPLNLSIVYWGGAGYGDLLFQFGLFMAVRPMVMTWQK